MRSDRSFTDSVGLDLNRHDPSVPVSIFGYICCTAKHTHTHTHKNCPSEFTDCLEYNHTHTLVT